MSEDLKPCHWLYHEDELKELFTERLRPWLKIRLLRKLPANACFAEGLLRHVAYLVEESHSDLNTLIAKAEERAWEAAREQEMYNGNDPDGNRAYLERDYPLGMKSIGFSVAHRQRYKTINDWRESKQRKGKSND